VALAVIEHADESAVFLTKLASHPKLVTSSSVVINTSHPLIDIVDDIGPAIDFFSHHANKELHGSCLLLEIGKKLICDCLIYSQFFFGVNAIVAFAKQKIL